MTCRHGQRHCRSEQWVVWQGGVGDTGVHPPVVRTIADEFGAEGDAVPVVRTAWHVMTTCSRWS